MEHETFEDFDRRKEGPRIPALREFLNALVTDFIDNERIFSREKSHLLAIRVKITGFKLFETLVDQVLVDEFVQKLNAFATRPINHAEIHEGSNSLIFFWIDKNHPAIPHFRESDD